MKTRGKKFLFIIFFVIILFVLFFIYYLYTVFTAKKMFYIKDKNLQIPIYTYHQIVETSDEVEIDYMQTTYKNFQNQVNGLLKIGYTPITYQELIDYKNENKPIYKKSCIITFDDGYESVYKYVYPFIKDNSIPITLFIVNNLVNSDGYLTWDQIKEMKDSGLVSVYSHGLNHSEYDKLGADILLSETEDSYAELKEKLNDSNMLKVFAYPCGFYTEDEIDILKKNGYIQNLMDGKINESKTLDLYKLHRVYPLNDSVIIILLKQVYKTFKY